MADLTEAWRHFVSTLTHETRVDRLVGWLARKLDRKDRP